MQEKITLKDIQQRCDAGTYQLVQDKSNDGDERVDDTNYIIKKLSKDGFFSKTKGINNNGCWQKRRAYIDTLSKIDEQSNEKEDKVVIEKLNDYINQLDSYQQAFAEYCQIQNKTDTDTAELLKSVEILRQKSAELHSLLISKPAIFVAPITSFIGATLGLALAPLAFLFGMVYLLFGLVFGGALALAACMPHTEVFSLSETIKILFFFAIAPIAIPYYTVIEAAKLGHRAGEHFFFKAPKAIDAFRETTMNIVEDEVSDYTFHWNHLTRLFIDEERQTEESSNLDEKEIPVLR